MFLDSALDLLAGVFGIARKTQELKNAPEMQSRAEAQREQSARDKTVKAIVTRDQEEIEKELAG